MVKSETQWDVETLKWKSDTETARQKETHENETSLQRTLRFRLSKTHDFLGTYSPWWSLMLGNTYICRSKNMIYKLQITNLTCHVSLYLPSKAFLFQFFSVSPHCKEDVWIHLSLSSSTIFQSAVNLSNKTTRAADFVYKQSPP